MPLLTDDVFPLSDEERTPPPEMKAYFTAKGAHRESNRQHKEKQRAQSQSEDEVPAKAPSDPVIGKKRVSHYEKRQKEAQKLPVQTSEDECKEAPPPPKKRATTSSSSKKSAKPTINPITTARVTARDLFGEDSGEEDDAKTRECLQDSGSSRPKDQSTVSESSKRFRAEFLEDWPEPPGPPYFDPSTNVNVTGLVGHPVILLCKVKNLLNRTVSWVRHRDIHLLTVGRYTYTSDQRFEATHSTGSEDWTLTIRSAQRRDTGEYECQISTTPPIGLAVYLNIVEPETEILGGPDLFIYAGSTINLTCIVRHTPEPPGTISWTHRGKTINFDSTRGGISLVTEKGVHSSSRLLVQSARTSDAGAYQCVPDNSQLASVRVHVLTGETPAAMQGSATWAGSLRLSILLFYSSTFALLVNK